ncbi:MAG: SUMF1/EgtB/PvdO family nonheme iron enzyme, partial [Chitinispirillaceae bacterium]|nr:SUMF1/EgtB/PvdO family nonheme iron enzyme [Chitinispirillaceae bacterium]
SIIDPSGIDSVYWTLNGTRAGDMTLVSGSTTNYELLDTLTTFRSNSIVIHAIDGSTRRNRDSAVVVLDYNLPPATSDTTVSTNRNVAKTWTLNVQSGDSDPLTWSRLNSPANGTVSGTLPAVTYTPTTNWAGVDSFFVRVTDGYWSDTAKIRITVANTLVAPTIETEPGNVTVNKGQSASFSVNLNTDVNPAPDYQWFKQGTATAVSTNATHTITATTYADAGSYRVIVSNSAGRDTSAWATLTVNDVTPPTVTLTSPANNATAVNIPVTLSWSGSDDNAIASYSVFFGTTNPPPTTPVAQNLTSDSYSPTGINYGTTYYWRVEASDGVNTGTSVVRYFRTGSQAAITVHPALYDTLCIPDDSARFAVTATGSGTIAYQWLRNGSAYTGSGASTGTISIGPGNGNDNDTFTCVVSNEFGMPDTSNKGTLKVGNRIRTITYGTGSGTISPVNPCVLMGQNQTFTVVPESRTVIAKLFKGNSPITPATTVSFTNVTTPDSVKATFFQVPVIMKRIQSLGRTFTMGFNNYFSAAPAHPVTLTYNFYMDSTQVTQETYSSLASAWPWLYESWSMGSNYPAWKMGWYDAIYYCNLRSKAAGLDTVYSYQSRTGQLYGSSGYTEDLVLHDLEIHYDRIGYRLCTEAEWEFAYRANGSTDYYWGDDYDANYPVTSTDSSKTNNNAWWWGNAGSDLHPVAQKLPNAFGLYDMVGNLATMCNDLTSASFPLKPLEYFTGTTPLTDPVGEDNVNGIIYRSYPLGSPEALAAFYRANYSKNGDSFGMGIRVVLPAQPIDTVITSQ